MAEAPLVTDQQEERSFSRDDVLLLLGRLDTATSLRMMIGGKANPPAEYDAKENKSWRRGHLEGLNEMGLRVRGILRAFYAEQGLNEEGRTPTQAEKHAKRMEAIKEIAAISQDAGMYD